MNNLVPKNTKEYEIISDSQTIKDIQIQVEKENQKLKEEETERAKASTSEEIVFEKTVINTTEEKKRTYDTAFEDEQALEPNKEETKTVKKLKSENSNSKTLTNGVEIIEQDDILCSSNSINDASDAISEDEDASVQTKPEKIKPIDKNTIMEEDEIFIEEDEIIIEESSNENKSASLRLEIENSNQFNGDSADSTGGVF